MGLDMYCCKLLIGESNTPDWQNICSVVWNGDRFCVYHAWRRRRRVESVIYIWRDARILTCTYVSCNVFYYVSNHSIYTFMVSAYCMCTAEWYLHWSHSLTCDMPSKERIDLNKRQWKIVASFFAKSLSSSEASHFKVHCLRVGQTHQVVKQKCVRSFDPR